MTIFSQPVLMDLDDKTIRRILIGLVIIIVLIFVVWKWKSKSTYMYPETTTSVGSFAVTSVASVNKSDTNSTPYYLLITTSTDHGFVSSGTSRDTVIFRNFVEIKKAKLNYPKQFILYTPPGTALSSKQFAILVPESTLPVDTSVSGTDPGATVETGYNNYKTRLQDAVNLYNTTLNDISIGILPSGKTATQAEQDAATARQTTYASASREYVENKCPYAVKVNDYVTDPSGAPTIKFDPSTTAFSRYRLTSGKGIARIQNEYSSIISASSLAPIDATNNYSSNTAVVQQARKADITGATRAYLSTVCPGFYTDVAGSSLETTYKTWDTTTTTSYRFTKPTTAQINNWATYSIDTSITTAVNSDGKLDLNTAKTFKGETVKSGITTPKATLVGSTIPELSGTASVKVSGTTATITTKDHHDFASGFGVIMSGFVPTTLNGKYIITVPSGWLNTFTITLATATTDATTLGNITPLVPATAQTSPQLVLYTAGSGSTSITKPAWQWARDYGPGSVATTLLPTELQGWQSAAVTPTTSNLVDTTTYV